MNLLRQILTLSFVLIIVAGLFPTVAAATSYSTISVHMDNVSFTSCSSTSLRMNYTAHHDYPTSAHVISYWNLNGVRMQTWSVTHSSPGPYVEFFIFSFAPQTTTYTFDVVWETWIDGVQVFESQVSGTCFGGDGFFLGPFTLTNAETSSVAGCDMQIALPATAVVGSFVANAEVYWAPGELVNPVVTIPAGKTAWVLGLDESGAYRKILWSCDFLWVPAETMGPNYDDVWNGRPLPTDVVD